MCTRNTYLQYNATRTLTIGGFRNRFIVVRFLFVRRPHRCRSDVPPLRDNRRRRHHPARSYGWATAVRRPVRPSPDQSSGVNRVVRFGVVVRVPHTHTHTHTHILLIYTHTYNTLSYVSKSTACRRALVRPPVTCKVISQSVLFFFFLRARVSVSAVTRFLVVVFGAFVKNHRAW